MRVTVAIDSFKGSLSTFQAGDAIREGILRADPCAEVCVRPLADGGEGTVDAMVSACNGEMRRVTVCGPLQKKVEAAYGIIPQREIAVIEMSAAAGITLVTPEERNPLYTTTYGVGEMIADAIERGCRTFIIGIGGSATNDGGVGMLRALGYEFLDGEGQPIPHGGIGLSVLRQIRTENALPALRECTFLVACDVKNPLCGETGCSAVYGPQKGATPEMVRDMDGWMQNYAALTEKIVPGADARSAGAGAAGGMGFAFLAYLNGVLQSGIQMIMKETDLATYVSKADLVITGEGRLDRQSCMGKAPVGVAELAKQYGKPVIAFSGCVTEDASECNRHGIDAFFPILRKPCTLEEAMEGETAYRNLRDTAEQAYRLFALTRTR